MPNLFDTIVKFRRYPVGLVADVEKAFHQILIAPDDRKMLRFLWFDDVFKDNPTIKQYQFRRLPFSLTSSPAILSTVIHHNLSLSDQKDSEIASLFQDSLMSTTSQVELTTTTKPRKFTTHRSTL